MANPVQPQRVWEKILEHERRLRLVEDPAQALAATPAVIVAGVTDTDDVGSGGTTVYAPAWDSFTVTDATVRTYGLSSTPLLYSEEVTLNGGRLSPSSYAISGNTVILGEGVTLTVDAVDPDVIDVHYWTPGTPAESSGVVGGGTFVDFWSAGDTSGGSNSILVPSSAIEGDLLVACLSGNNGYPDNSLVTEGWTLLGEAAQGPSGLETSYSWAQVYARMAPANPGGMSYSYTAGGLATINQFVAAYRGPTVVGAQIAGGGQGGATTASAPAIAASPGGVVVRLFAFNDADPGNGVTVGAGPTVRGTLAINSTQECAAFADEFPTSSPAPARSATNPRSATWGGWVCFSAYFPKA